MRRALGAVVASLVVWSLGGCVTTAEKSAKIAAEGSHLIAVRKGLRITKPNASVRVVHTTLLRTQAGTAAAVQLRSSGGRAQADVPLLVDVRGAGGASVYRNDTAGLQPSLQRVGLVRPGRTTWWVTDQVAATGTPKRATARVGPGAPVKAPPRVGLTHVRFETDAGGRFLTGTVRNHSGVLLRDTPIFAVALRGRKVVAAGRALVPRLPATPGPKPVRFRLFFFGPTTGARVELSVAPTRSSPSTATPVQEQP